ncbi:cation transporter [uncultured Maricaulis sp.]|uniref:cation transporter n=1 Tax=uncultured Maricaulis sp. TaxID=174710 RepID=UPI0030DAC432|tara:strand:+ start:6278 stop:6910 length:633 start_codon:yes stop_codon:yes gene_type:complete
MSASCCETKQFDGMSPGFKRALIAVIIINAGMFIVEMLAGAAAQSQALKADALDFFADAATYGLSLWVIGKPPRWRANAALAKAGSLFVMGAAILALAFYRAIFVAQPVAELMGGIALLALAANVISVLILMRWRDGDANVRSVWLCSRNDAVGNIAVFISAGVVWITHSHWPDIIVAVGMAGLFLTSAFQILVQARSEIATTGAKAHHH